MSEITVREVTAEDIADADQVWSSALETLRETYRPTASFLKDVWTPPSNLTRLVALFDGRAAGTLTYYIEDDRLHIMRFGVQAELRGKGVGRAMVEYAEEIARDMGLRCVSVYTIKECGTVPVYEHLGFTLLSEKPAEWVESDKYDTLTDAYLERPIRAVPT